LNGKYIGGNHTSVADGEGLQLGLWCLTPVSAQKVHSSVLVSQNWKDRCL
jgi:hypothetical protein